MTVEFKLKRGNSSEWTAKDPILLAGEPGFETDSKRYKIGDGRTKWSGLPYYLNETAVSELISNALSNVVVNGVPGDSAYEVAVKNGFVGDATAWLASLKSTEPGPPGADSTVPGPPGDSAYQIAVQNGFSGTEAEWLSSLKGEDYVGPNLVVSDTAPTDLTAIWVDISS